MFQSFYSLFSLSVYVTLSLYLNIYERHIQKWKSSFQSNKIIGTSTLWGWEKLGRPFFPPSLIFRSSIDRLVFRFMLLFHSILTFMKDLYQSENQVFNPTRLLVLLHCNVGKDWAGPFFPPSKMFRSFSLSSRLLDYVILLLYLNSLNLYQAENQVFKPTKLFVIVGWGKTGPAHSFPPL